MVYLALEAEISRSASVKCKLVAIAIRHSTFLGGFGNVLFRGHEIWGAGGHIADEACDASNGEENHGSTSQVSR